MAPRAAAAAPRQKKLPETPARRPSCASTSLSLNATPVISAAAGRIRAPSLPPKRAASLSKGIAAPRRRREGAPAREPMGGRASRCAAAALAFAAAQMPTVLESPSKREMLEAMSKARADDSRTPGGPKAKGRLAHESENDHPWRDQDDTRHWKRPRVRRAGTERLLFLRAAYDRSTTLSTIWRRSSVRTAPRRYAGPSGSVWAKILAASDRGRRPRSNAGAAKRISSRGSAAGARTAIVSRARSRKSGGAGADTGRSP